MKRLYDQAFYHNDCRNDWSKYPSKKFATNIELPLRDHRSEPNKVQNTQRKFCSRCAEIDFKEIFSATKDHGHTGLAVTELRTDFDLSCSFCTFVMSFAAKKPSPNNPSILDRGYHLRAFDSLKVLRLKRRADRLQTGATVVLAVVAGSESTQYIHAQQPLNAAISKGLIVPTADLPALEHSSKRLYNYSGRKVLRTSPDFSLLKAWIYECKSSRSTAHEFCNQKREYDLSNVLVIDCVTRKLVPLQKDWQYLALSYVWGAPESQSGRMADESVASNLLPSQIPQTVKDAITAVMKLGQRYLWVDRYCIKSTVDKHLQIQNMGLVYEAALATIVAVPGQDSEFGLPGISAARYAQPWVETSVGTLVSTGCHISHHTSSSTWYTRGWTYQEAFLSCRCLFFTCDQVFFACKSSYRAERVYQQWSTKAEKAQHLLEPPLLTLETQINFRIAKRHPNQFMDHLAEYTTRCLTKDADGLAAFKGMLSRQKFYSYWGIPVMSHANTSRQKIVENSFAMGLSWFCQMANRDNESVIRRQIFPSWSWASVRGQISCYDDSVLKAANLRPNCARFSIEKKNGEVVSISEFLQAELHKGLTILEESLWLQITSFMTRVCLKQSEQQGRYKAYEVDPVLASSLNVDSVVIESSDTTSVARQNYLFEAYIDTFTDQDLLARLEQETWNMIALYYSRGYRGLAGRRRDWLLLDWRGKTAYRIGLGRNMRSVPKYAKMTTIRLG